MIFRASLLLALLIALTSASLAQASDAVRPKPIPDSPPARLETGCDPGRAEAFLDANNVNALLFNNGALGWRGGDAIYEVPRGSGKSPLFTTSLWVGGTIDGDYRAAASEYGPYEFWPGPVDVQGNVTPRTCEQFDRMWSVGRNDIEGYRSGGGFSRDLSEWPISWGAPFYVDTNLNNVRDPETEPRIELDLGDPGYGTRQIDLAAGERPDIVGDRGVWWVMNDVGNTHEWTESPPLGVEVRILAYSFSDARDWLNESIYYTYTILNRSGETITDLRASLFADPDIGYFEDDFIAGDANRGLLIAYNGDEFDEGSRGYGGQPPAFGIDILSGAAGAMPINRDISTGLPSTLVIVGSTQYFLWLDGTPITRGLGGFNTGDEVTTWIFDGDPVQYGYWSEERRLPEGIAGPQESLVGQPGDRKAAITSTPSTLAPGEQMRVDVAFLFGYRGQNRLQNVARLQDISDGVQAAYDTGGLPAIADVVVPYRTPPSPPPTTALVAPADGTDFDAGGRPDEITLEWTPVAGADAYLIDLATNPEFTEAYVQFRSFGSSLVVPASSLPGGLAPLTYWRVRPANWGGTSGPMEVRTFVYPVFQPALLLFSNGTPAFVEIASPTGIDPCGPAATSTEGCDEVGGNGVLNSFNSDETYVLGTLGPAGTEAVLAAFAPHDFEIRFTEAGSYAVYPFVGTVAEVTAIRVPFEVWDVGIERPFGVSNPTDDVQMIPILFADTGGSCAFNYGEGELFGQQATDRIYAYYPIDANEDGTTDNEDYAAYAASASALIPTDDACAEGQAAFDGPYSFIDFGKGRPLQRQVFVDNTETGDVSTLQGTVVRFYTNAPPVSSESSPRAQVALGAAFPNPVRGTLTIPYQLRAPGDAHVALFDALGREVAALADGLHTSGAHETTFDTSGLAAGIYTVRLTTTEARAVRQIAVVR